MNLGGKWGRQSVYGVLLLFVADWPACGDCLGGMDHSGAKGCGMCKGCVLKKRVELVIGDERTRDEHLRAARKYKMAKTKKERSDAYSASGLRPCAFLDLPYFDASRVQVAEPMHFLLLGLCLDLIRQCKESNYLPEVVFPSLEVKSRQLHLPREECARPINGLGSKASALKADQVLHKYP